MRNMVEHTISEAADIVIPIKVVTSHVRLVFWVFKNESSFCFICSLWCNMMQNKIWYRKFSSLFFLHPPPPPHLSTYMLSIVYILFIEIAVTFEACMGMELYNVTLLPYCWVNTSGSEGPTDIWPPSMKLNVRSQKWKNERFKALTNICKRCKV